MDHLLRVAIWEAHERRCAYTGDPIRFADLEIDHVIPQRLRQRPEELSQTLHTLQLPPDFDLDGIENLLPSSGRANRQKGASTTDLRTAHALELARTKTRQIKQIRDRLEKEDQVALARLQLSIAIEQGAIGYSELQNLISELETNPSIVQLHHPIIFAHGEQVDRLTRSDAMLLLDKPISPRPHGLEALTLVGAGDATRRVHTAREWLVAKKDGLYPKSNYDVKEEAFFLHVAVVTWAIQRNMPHEKTFLADEGVGSIEMLPPLLLPHISGDDYQHLLELQSRGETVGSILETNGVVPNRNVGLLSFDYEGMHTVMWEVMRGSFSGDGHEEILVQQYERTLKGTYAIVHFLILQRIQPSGPFQFLELSVSDLQPIV